MMRYIDAQTFLGFDMYNNKKHGLLRRFEMDTNSPPEPIR